MSAARTMALAIAIIALHAAPARAQDFAAPAGSETLAALGSPSDLLERGLPPARPRSEVQLTLVRWHALPDLTTRGAAAAAGWGAMRVAAGLSQTGEPDIGWTALGAALGLADERGGAALRAVARRDRTSRFGFDAEGAAVGAEVGGGAWVAVSPAVQLWASAPQLWTRGEAPPEARSLQIGVAATIGTLAAWVAREEVPGLPRGGRGEHAVGLGTSAGPIAIAVGMRDQPLRGGLTIGARALHVAVAAQVESHPVLGETVRLSLAAGGAR